MSDFGGSSSDQSSSPSSSNNSDATPSDSDHGREDFERLRLDLQNIDHFQRRIEELEARCLDYERTIGDHASTISRQQAVLAERQQEEEIVERNNRERMDAMADEVVQNRNIAEGRCAEAAALENDIYNLKTKLEESEVALVEKNREIERVRHQLAGAVSLLEASRDESTLYRNQLNNVETKLLAANSTITELQQSQNRANEPRIQSENTESRLAAGKIINELQDSLVKAREETVLYYTLLQKSELQLANASKNIKELQETSEKSNQTMTELRQELYLSNNENKKLVEAMEVLKTHVSTAEEQLRHQETATTSTANNHSDLAIENEMLKKTITNLEANVVLLRSACNNYREENERLMATVSGHDHSMSEQKSTYRTLSERLESNLRREDSLEIANVDLQRHVSELSSTLESERRIHSRSIVVLRERIDELMLEHAAEDGRSQIEHLLELLRPATEYANVLVERRNREIQHEERLRLLGEVVVRVEALMLTTRSL